MDSSTQQKSQINKVFIAIAATVPLVVIIVIVGACIYYKRQAKRNAKIFSESDEESNLKTLDMSSDESLVPHEPQKLADLPEPPAAVVQSSNPPTLHRYNSVIAIYSPHDGFKQAELYYATPVNGPVTTMDYDYPQMEKCNMESSQMPLLSTPPEIPERSPLRAKPQSLRTTRRPSPYAQNLNQAQRTPGRRYTIRSGAPNHQYTRLEPLQEPTETNYQLYYYS